jgi:serralysin
MAFFQGDSGNDTRSDTTDPDQFLGGGGDDILDDGTGGDFMYGEGSNDFLDGLNGNDTLLGGAGNDNIVGDLGNDNLFGGIGQDAFGLGQSASVFISANLGGTTLSLRTQPPYNPAYGVDTIYDFTVGEDKIYLARAFELSNGRNDLAFVSNDNQAEASSGRVVYSRSTGNLFFNPNGGGAGFGDTGGQIATIVSAPNLSATDFVTQGESFSGLVGFF